MAQAQPPRTGAELKSKFKPLKEADIQKETDGGSYSRGSGYYRNGNIFETVVRGNTLRAFCEGSDDEPYLVKATLALAEDNSASPLVDYDCTCLRGGFCKHIVAMLLTWVHKPEEFEARPEFAELLKDKKREELLTLITRMLEEEPSLESLLDLPSPVAAAESGGGGKLTVDPAVFRKQAASAFRGANYEWGSGGRVASSLDKLVRLASGYVEAGQWANAQAVYTALAEEIPEHYEEVDDEEGELEGVLDECGEGLAKCLDAQSTLSASERLEPAQRASLIQTLLNFWNSEVGSGDYAAEVPDVLARNVTDTERAEVERWLRGQKRGGGEFTQNYHNQGIVHFLITLKEHSGIDKEELLQEYENFGLKEEKALLLVELGRVDEAMQMAAAMPDAQAAYRIAHKLLETGGNNIERAFAFIEERLAQTEETKQGFEVDGYLRWLGEKYLAHQRPEKAFAVELRRFEARPHEGGYQLVKAAAQAADPSGDLWQQARPQLISALEIQKDWSSLATLYLKENDVRAALDALPPMKESQRGAFYGGSYLLSNIRLQVAEAAEKPYPDEARAIYREIAEDLINQRGRDSYRQAAEYLARVQRLYEAQKRTEDWKEYITDLRQRNKSLRALKEELDARNLN